MARTITGARPSSALQSDIGPFAIVPEWVLFSVGDAALRLFCILARMTNTEGIAWPSITTLSTRSNMARRTVVRSIQELEAAGALTVTARQHETGGYASNVYQLHFAIPSRAGVSPPSIPNDIPSIPNDTTLVSLVTPSPSIPNGTLTKANRRTKANRTNTVSFDTESADAFEVFWTEYRALNGRVQMVKSQAKAAWAKALTRATADVILEGLRAFAAYVPTVRTAEFCPVCMPTTFLNQNRWEAEYTSAEALATAVESSPEGQFVAWFQAEAAGNTGQPTAVPSGKAKEAAGPIMAELRRLRGQEPGEELARGLARFVISRGGRDLSFMAACGQYGDAFVADLRSADSRETSRQIEAAMKTRQDQRQPEYLSYRRAFYRSAVANGRAELLDAWKESLDRRRKRMADMSPRALEQFEQSLATEEGRADLFADWLTASKAKKAPMAFEEWDKAFPGTEPVPCASS